LHVASPLKTSKFTHTSTRRATYLCMGIDLGVLVPA
jgi:hypothetical protein